MGVAKSFRDLRVYQLTREAVSEIFEAFKGFPPGERYELTDQIRRSARATKALSRMIDRADDFCKYCSDTDYRGIVKEDPLIVDDSFFNALDEKTP
ncbi:MAG: four helix bundle protein [Verrucomicrobia bacterium]|nr:four helix bundle protein [Verrucomicrobiota bacterium]